MTPLEFLHLLKENNNREWFNENKHHYLEAREQFIAVVDQLIEGITRFDPAICGNTGKDAVYRIYRDVRFSKDKSPYKGYFSAYIAPGGRKSNLAGYYIHFEPDGCLAGGGLHCPKNDELKEIRFEIYNHVDEFGRIIGSSDFKRLFGELWGEKLKRPPKGFPKEFPQIEWLKHKKYLMLHRFPESKTKEEHFVNYVLNVFQKMKPLNDFLNRAVGNE